MTSRPVSPGGRAEAIGGALVGVASVQFGIVVVLGKLAQRSGISNYAMLSVRFALAALALAVVLAALRQSMVPAGAERWWLLALGIVGYAVEASLFFAALRHGEAAAVTLLFFTYPVFVAVASIALGRGRPSNLVTIALVLAMAGTAIVVAFSGRLTISGLGIALALGSALSFTAYLLVLDTFVRRTAPLVTSMWVAGSASVALAVYALGTSASWHTAGGKTWVELAGMGVATAGAFVSLFMGLRRLGPVRTSIIAAAEPLATTILAWVILAEAIHVSTAIGGALILAGAVMATIATSERPPEPPTP